MGEKGIARYFELLSQKIVKMFGVSKEQADSAIQKSAIQKMIREAPEYVDHVPLSSWAEEVYQESIQKPYCINCNRDVPYSVKNQTIEMVAYGVPFHYTEQTAYCYVCREEVYVTEINDANVAAWEKEYRIFSERKWSQIY